MTERQMATIRRIDKIEPIEGADKIVKATVGGWQLVTAIDNGFKEGDLVVYCEIDSWMPTSVAPFLTKPGHSPKVFNGVEGEKLRSIKLRGTVSQGLILPLSVAIDRFVGSDFDSGEELCEIFQEGYDVTDILGIQKWEAPINAQLAGIMKGNFPSRIPKTDQERIQNLKRELECEYPHLTWEVSEKLEGSSMTVYVLDGEFGVCSRNLDLLRDENNSFWATAIKLKLEEKLLSVGVDISIQGELIGPGIQDNIYGLSEHAFRVFDVIDVNTCSKYLPQDRRTLCVELGLDQTPIIETEYVINETMQELIDEADGSSRIPGCKNAVAREGLVFKANEKNVSFKVISNKYLLKQKD